MSLRPQLRASPSGPPETGAVQTLHAATFAERGVIVPFTTPALTGTRARVASATGLDLVVPNPTGRRGVYLLTWSSVDAFCRATVHDRCLMDRLLTQFQAGGVLDPPAVRAVARGVALDGLAGADAAAAAAGAAAAEAAAADLIAAALLRRLLEQAGDVAGGAAGGVPAAAAELSASIAGLAAAVAAAPGLAQVAPRLLPLVGADGAGLAALAQRCGRACAAAGLGDGARPGRLAALLAELGRMDEQWAVWMADPADPAARIAALASAALAMTRLVAGALLPAAEALVAAPAALLQEVARDPSGGAAALGRPGWVLDGWDRIAARWSLAEDAAGQRTALSEFALMVPPLPQEAAAWCGRPLDVEAPEALRRGITLPPGQRSALAVMDDVSRNERLLAAQA